MSLYDKMPMLDGKTWGRLATQPREAVRHILADAPYWTDEAQDQLRSVMKTSTMYFRDIVIDNEDLPVNTPIMKIELDEEPTRMRCPTCQEETSVEVLFVNSHSRTVGVLIRMSTCRHTFARRAEGS